MEEQRSKPLEPECVCVRVCVAKHAPLLELAINKQPFPSFSPTALGQVSPMVSNYVHGNYTCT